MSISSMQALTQMTGGLDTSTMIQELDSINRQSIYQSGGLNDQVSQLQQQQTDWQNVNNSALTLQNLLDSLNSSTTFGSFTATPTDNTIITASAGTAASPGTYSINVTGIGSNATLVSGGRLGNALTNTDSINTTKLSTPITTGTFAVNVNGTALAVTVNSGDTIQNVLDNINTQITNAGLTALTWTVNNDGSIQYDTKGQTVSFGSAGDSSNFAHDLGLDVASSIGGGSYKTNALGQVQLGQYLQNPSANYATPLTSTTTGSFAINNVKIMYNTATDTLSTILNRINTSGAGVTAAYDPIKDQVTLTSNSSQTISVTDDPAQGYNGNLMEALKLTSATGGVSSAGTPWSLSVNGTSITSVSGTVTNAIPGVSINLLKTGQTTLTIASDTTQAVNQIQSFVSQFNSLYSMIGNLTAKGGDLQFDPTLTDFQSSIRDAVTSPIKTIGWDSSNNPISLPNYPQQTLMGIGISTGAVGSAVGTTNSLTVDTNTLTAALQQNPAMVRDLIKGMSIQLNQVLANMTGTVNSLTNPNLNVSSLTGMSSSQNTMFQNMILDLNNQIQLVNDTADQQKQLLTDEFTAMNEAISQSKSQMTYLLSFASGSSLL